MTAEIPTQYDIVYEAIYHRNRRTVHMFMLHLEDQSLQFSHDWYSFASYAHCGPPGHPYHCVCVTPDILMKCVTYHREVGTGIYEGPVKASGDPYLDHRGCLVGLNWCVCWILSRGSNTYQFPDLCDEDEALGGGSALSGDWCRWLVSFL